MSGDTVIGQTLQFTNDNKHAYGNSGFSATNSTTPLILLEFATESYYLIAQIIAVTSGVSNEDFKYKIKFNDIDVNEIYYIDTYKSYNMGQTEFRYIIPPHTRVKITGESVGGTSGSIGVMLTAKVGMAQRVGNLDE